MTLGRARGSAAVALIALGYLALRLPLVWKFPLYFDEAFYASQAWVAKRDPAQRFVSLLDKKGPLLTWLSFPLQAAGIEPRTALRLVGLVAGLWTLAMVGLLARRLGGPAMALVAMALWAVVPFSVVQNAMGIHEPLVTAALMTALVLQLELAARPRLDIALLLGAVMAAGLLVKQHGLFALVLLPLSLLCFSWGEPHRARRLGLWSAFALLAVAIAVLGFSIERLSPQFYADVAWVDAYNMGIGEALRDPVPLLQFNWPYYAAAIRGYLTVPLLLLAAVGAGLALSQRPRVGAIMVAWVLVPVGAATLLTLSPLARYMLPAVPIAVVLAAHGLTSLVSAVWARLEARTALRPTVAAALALALVPAAVLDARVLVQPSGVRLPGYDDRELQADFPAGEGWRVMAEAVRERARDPVTVVGFVNRPNGIVMSNLLDDPGQQRYRLTALARQPYADQVPGMTMPPGDLRAMRFVVENGVPAYGRCHHRQPAPSVLLGVRACSPLPAHSLRLLREYRGPRNGQLLRLYEVTGPLPPPYGPPIRHP